MYCGFFCLDVCVFSWCGYTHLILYDGMQLLNKLKLRGMNALFNLRVNVREQPPCPYADA